jgi:pimeloyl-ACP methyl ester carboxylesterase
MSGLLCASARVSIRVPIRGKRDNFIEHSDVRKLENALANASLEEIDDCGHIPQEEQPANASRLVKDFLQ